MRASPSPSAMALPFGKLAILVGAGVVGSVLAKEGGLSSVSDIFSGAFKLVLKGIKQNEPTKSMKKPHNDFLMAQVNSLREELQMLASNRPVTIITATGLGASRYSAVLVVVVGSGYIWWKGWKLPDLMFATRRSLSEARNAFAKQLENVYSSIGATKRQLSSRMDSLDNNLDEIAQFTASIKETISGVSTEMDAINANVAFVRSAVENLESKIGRIESKQDTTSNGVLHLCNFVSTLSLNEPAERIQDLPATSRGTPEAAPVTPSRINSVPPRGLLHELPESFNSSGHCQERDEDSSGTESSAMNGAGTQESMKGGQSLSYGLLSRRLTGINTSHLLTSSLGSTVLHRVRSSTQQS
ncbi:hypothetical protein SAY87_001742 [Trapa incisa]|uniref:DUF1664 domain-containing protein n=1 Tax=Trapa incisa TaxID=236973 RepID=A0AAN7JYJ6_9MYRT|nr:hypothetical protein SAY87_001742 [Trapa incisa]